MRPDGRIHHESPACPDARPDGEPCYAHLVATASPAHVDRFLGCAPVRRRTRCRIPQLRRPRALPHGVADSAARSRSGARPPPLPRRSAHTPTRRRVRRRDRSRTGAAPRERGARARAVAMAASERFAAAAPLAGATSSPPRRCAQPTTWRECDYFEPRDRPSAASASDCSRRLSLAASSARTSPPAIRRSTRSSPAGWRARATARTS